MVPPLASRGTALQMKRSSVVGTNGSSVLDTIRTSYGTFIRYVLSLYQLHVVA